MQRLPSLKLQWKNIRWCRCEKLLMEVNNNNKESWRLEETYCHSDVSGKPSAIADVKSSYEWIIIIIILWNKKVTIVPIVIGALGTITKGLLKDLEDLEVGRQVETIQTTALLRTARILKRVLETCCHSNSSEKPSTNADVKSSLNNNNWSARNVSYQFVRELEELEIGGRAESIQTTSVLRPTRILRKALVNEGDLL